MSNKQAILAFGSTHRTVHGPISTTQLVKYAGASGDFNRIHFDYPFAREVGLDGVLAHGMLTMGFAATCLAEHVGEGVSVSRLSARFLAPVMAEDLVEVVSTVNERSSSVAHLELVATVDTKVVLRGTAIVDFSELDISD